MGVYPAEQQTLIPFFTGLEAPNLYADIKDNTYENVCLQLALQVS